MTIPTPLFAMLALVAIQVSIALVYKLSGSKGHYAFSPASALAMAELTKLFMSCCFHIRATPALWSHSFDSEPILGTPTGSPASNMLANGDFLGRLKISCQNAQLQLNGSFIMQTSGLAFMYLCNNHLAFQLFLIADPGTISLFKSGSGFVSAIVLWCIARGIAVNQWICVLLQAFGLALAQYDPCTDHARYSSGTYMFLLATVMMTTLSGIWNEHLVKTHKVSLNVQNCCLYIFGFLFNFSGFYIRRAAGFDNKGFLEGYDSLGAIMVVVSNSVVGLAITAVYKYADVMVKQVGNVVSTSILIVLGLMLFGETTSFQSVIGCSVVFCATYLYFQGGTSQPSATGDNINKTAALAVTWKKVLFRSSITLSTLFLILFVILSSGSNDAASSNSPNVNDKIEIASTNSSHVA